MPTVETVTLNRGNSTFELNHTMVHKFASQSHMENKDIALSFLTIPFSWRNITGAYGNNTFKYEWADGLQYSVIVPDGYYSVDELSTYVQLVMKTRGHYLIDNTGLAPVDVYYFSFTPNNIYYTIEFTLTEIPQSVPGGWINPSPGVDPYTLAPVPAWTAPPVVGNEHVKLVIDNAEFGKILGFGLGTYPTTPPIIGFGGAIYRALLVPELDRVTSINIGCNMVNNILQLNKTLFSVTPDVGYTSYINRSVTFPLFHHLTDGSYSEVRITFTDQDDNPIVLIDQDIQVSLIIQSKD